MLRYIAAKFFGRLQLLESVMFRASAVLALSCTVVGCFPCGTIVVTQSVRVTILDSATMDAISEVAVGGETLTDGEVTDVKLPSIPAEVGIGVEEITEDGSVTLEFLILGGACFGPFAPRTDFTFPVPDQVRIAVVRDDCEQVFVIDLNENTVVDISFPDNVIELKDPILVPACDP